MSQILAPKFLLVAGLVLALTGCSSAPVDQLPRPSGTAPIVIDPGSDLYSDASNAMSDLESSEDVGVSDSPSDEPSSTLDKDLCDRIGKQAIEFSKIAAEETGAVYIDRLLEGKVVVDNRETIGTPKPGTALVRVECFMTVAISNGERGTVNIYELLDSDGKLRVRWDNYTPGE
jgi:hypothetical protein